MDKKVDKKELPLNLEIINLIKNKPNIIKELYKAMDYKFFEKGSYNVNNFGIRVSTEGRNFDDIIGTIFRKDEDGDFIIECFEGTTDPGSYYLKNPININGTAILVPGQYHGYRLDKHRGQYDALCQRSGKVNVYRDNDSDEIIEIDLDTLKPGMYGINIHKTSAAEQAMDKNMFSAGCQEIMNSAEYNLTWMPIQYKAIQKYGKAGADTYTLFDLKDFAKILGDNYLDKIRKIKTESINEEE